LARTLATCRTYISANEFIRSLGTLHVDVLSVDVGANLKALDQILSEHSVALTFGLEQTIVPTSGSRLPDVVPRKFLKWMSEIVRLLCRFGQ
jgi:hypothetical protein